MSDTWGFGDGNLAAGRQRVALFGSLEPVTSPAEITKVEAAYLAAHPDARGWIPPNGPHSAFYARLRVNRVYDFGGFGDVAFIGWLPLELYREAGAKMRSEKEVKKDWPEPKQPEEELLGSWKMNEMFEERAPERWADRLRIEW